jgi:hypothetical protein
VSATVLTLLYGTAKAWLLALRIMYVCMLKLCAGDSMATDHRYHQIRDLQDSFISCLPCRALRRLLLLLLPQVLVQCTSRPVWLVTVKPGCC